MGLTMNKELGQWRYYRNERPRENLEREPQLPMAKKVGRNRPDRYSVHSNFYFPYPIYFTFTLRDLTSL